MTKVVFLDTTILIAWFVHPQPIKQFIAKTLDGFNFRVSSLVAKQEFCRRLLREADYLQRLLARKKSFKLVFEHVVTVLTNHHGRKKQICLQSLSTCFRDDSDGDQTERLSLFLDDLLENGLEDLNEIVDSFAKNSGCANGLQGVRRKRTSWVFPPRECQPKTCTIDSFLASLNQLNRLLHFLSSRNDLTTELDRALSFLRQLSPDCSNAKRENPCLTVGDLIIALESDTAGATFFFTQNKKESVILCEHLNQQLIVCPVNPDNV